MFFCPIFIKILHESVSASKEFKISPFGPNHGGASGRYKIQHIQFHYAPLYKNPGSAPGMYICHDCTLSRGSKTLHIIYEKLRGVTGHVIGIN